MVSLGRYDLFPKDCGTLLKEFQNFGMNKCWHTKCVFSIIFENLSGPCQNFIYAVLIVYAVFKRFNLVTVTLHPPNAKCFTCLF